MKELHHDLVYQGLRLLLRPIVGFCIRHAVKVQEMLDLVKTIFLEVATEQVRQQHEVESVSRLSVITGLQRREVSRLLNKREKSPPEINLLTRIIGRWQRHSSYSHARSGPKTLSFEGKESEFAKLVQSVSKDLNSYTVLFELERVNAIERVPGGIRLKAGVYVPKASAEQGFRMLASDMSDLISAVEQNVTQENVPPHLHIKTHYDNVCPEFLPEIREWFLDEGTKFHASARKYLSQFDKDLNPSLFSKDGGARVAIGTFSLVDEGIVQERAEQKNNKGQAS